MNYEEMEELRRRESIVLTEMRDKDRQAAQEVISCIGRSAFEECRDMLDPELAELRQDGYINSLLDDEARPGGES